MSDNALTAGELRAALADVPDDQPVMVVVNQHTAGWLRRVRLDDGARTVDLLGGVGALDRTDEYGHTRTLAAVDTREWWPVDSCYAADVGMQEHCRGSACTSTMCGPRDKAAQFVDPQAAENADRPR